jgi:hypothetical protein
MVLRSQDLVGIANEEINSPESPYSGWMNARLEHAALKLALEYPWFHPAIFNDSNYTE